jgi:hypothetical protein
MQKKKHIRNAIIITSTLSILFLAYGFFTEKKQENYSPAVGFFVHVNEKLCSRNTEFKGTAKQMRKLCPEGFSIMRKVRI